MSSLSYGGPGLTAPTEQVCQAVGVMRAWGVGPDTWKERGTRKRSGVSSRRRNEEMGLTDVSHLGCLTTKGVPGRAELARPRWRDCSRLSWSGQRANGDAESLSESKSPVLSRRPTAPTRSLRKPLKDSFGDARATKPFHVVEFNDPGLF